MDKRVLLADDEIAILDGLTWMFETEQLETAAASTRADAVALLDVAFYPVLVTDLCLHSCEEGLALIDHVMAESPRTRIVVFSAFATSYTRDCLSGRSVAHVLQKPATSELLDVVQALLVDVERDDPAAGPERRRRYAAAVALAIASNKTSNS